jgi:predicted aminopeptidase
MRTHRLLLCLIILPLLPGCADTRYYLQSIGGHLQMLQAARPIEQWLADETVDPALKQRLTLARQIRSFAVSEFKLPDNASYARYADLQRPFAVWNVVAAPELSLSVKTWCFPVAGCVAYRGYFDPIEARAKGQALRDEGFDVSVYGVPAYSTLGWMNWAGGDPLLNTLVRYPEAELARLIFHELAHQVVYVKDDTVFNESFASAVERLAGARWLAAQGSPQSRREYAEFDARRQQFRALALGARERLQSIYIQSDGLRSDKQTLLAKKRQAILDFREDYARLKHQWGGYSGYDGWVADANNASFGIQAAYDELVPAFENLFEREGRDWQRFYDAVRRLAQEPGPQRIRLLKQLSGEPPRG